MSDERELAGRFGVIRGEAANEWVAAAPTTLDPPDAYDSTFGLKRFGMQGNAQYGNCFWAALVHAMMLQALLSFDAKPVYAKGFKAPASDAGVKWYEAYERENGQSTQPPGDGTGIFTGVASIAKQKLALSAGVVQGPFTPELIRQAIYDFDGGALFCLALDPKAQQEFNDHEPWGTLSTNPDAQDGHAVAGAAYSPSGLTFVTWAALEGSTDAFDLNCIDGLVLVITHGYVLKHGVEAAQALESKWGLTSIEPLDSPESPSEGFWERVTTYLEKELHMSEENEVEETGSSEDTPEVPVEAPEVDSAPPAPVVEQRTPSTFNEDTAAHSVFLQAFEARLRGVLAKVLTRATKEELEQALQTLLDDLEKGDL